MSLVFAFLLGFFIVIVLEIAAVALIVWQFLRRERGADTRFWNSPKAKGDRDEA